MNPTQQIENHLVALVSAAVNLGGLHQIKAILASIEAQAKAHAAKTRKAAVEQIRSGVTIGVTDGRLCEAGTVTASSLVFGRDADGGEFAQQVAEFPQEFRERVIGLQVPGKVDANGISLEITEAYDEIPQPAPAPKPDPQAIGRARKQGRKKGR